MDINDVTKFKILDALKNKDELIIWQRFLRSDDNHCFECPLVEFAQVVSIGKKYIEEVRYDVVSRILDVLVSSIGHGIEKHIIENAIKKPSTLSEFVKIPEVARISAPEILERAFEDRLKDMSTKEFLSYAQTIKLKENQFINHNTEWMYSVFRDRIEVIEEEDKYIIKGTVELAMTRIHIQGVGQMSEGIG